MQSLLAVMDRGVLTDGSCPQSQPSEAGVPALCSILPRFAPRADCGCTYHIRVQLASADYIILASFEPPPVTIEQWNDATWKEVRPRLPALPLTFPRVRQWKNEGQLFCGTTFFLPGLNGCFSPPPQVSHTFSDYPPGVRHILFQHGGQDTQFWKGWYGPRVTNSSIIISHRTAKNPAPARPLPEEAVVMDGRHPALDAEIHPLVDFF